MPVENHSLGNCSEFDCIMPVDAIPVFPVNIMVSRDQEDINVVDLARDNNGVMDP
jgi:hypothetical protein